MFYVFVVGNFVDGEVFVDVVIGMGNVDVFIGLGLGVVVFGDFY